MSRAARDRIATALEVSPGAMGALVGDWRGREIIVRPGWRFDLALRLEHPLAPGLCLRAVHPGRPARESLRCFAVPRILEELLQDAGLEAAFSAALEPSLQLSLIGKRLMLRFPGTRDPAQARDWTGRAAALAARLDARLVQLAPPTPKELEDGVLRQERELNKRAIVFVGALVANAAACLGWWVAAGTVPAGLGIPGGVLVGISAFRHATSLCRGCGSFRVHKRQRSDRCSNCGLEIRLWW